MPRSHPSPLSDQELQALVERLVDHHPDLAALIEAPPSGDPERVDGEAVRRRVEHILRTMGDDWRASTRAQFELLPVVAMGDTYRADGRWEDARAVYRAVIDATLPVYEQLRDEESEIVGIVGDCVDGLGACIEASADPGFRELLLRDVFEVYRWDTLDRGGYGMGDAAVKVFRACVDAGEKARLGAWMRAALGKSSRWGRQEGGRWVLSLVGSSMDAAGREALYREAGLEKELLDLLLDQGRQEEAILLVQQAVSGDLLSLAERLCRAGLDAAAVDAVNRHPSVLEPRAHGLRDWLVKRGRGDERGLEALVWGIHRFSHSGNVGDWMKLRADAEAAGRLAQVLPWALDAVNTDRVGFQPARVRVLATAGRLEEAERVLARLPEAAWKRAALELAAAAETSRPELSVALYTRVADGLRAKRTKPARLELADVQARLRAIEVRAAAPGETGPA